MKLNGGVRWCLALIWVCLFTTPAFCDSSYDRELIVKDKTRATQVEKTFKELMAAYEDEDAQGFLDLVSDERFRQDYMTFTDALYNDFRTYEIRQVDYWIDRVVPDHVKQFLYVRWEKRYEDLDDGQQFTSTGYSRFLFDEVDGDYLLVELAGNSLFGGSLPEWVEEVSQIPGQEMQQSSASDDPYVPETPGATCDSQHLSLCDGSMCSSYGGYWYNNTCNTTPQSQGQPDLVVRVVDIMASSSDATLYYEVENVGTEASGDCQVEAAYRSMTGAPVTASGAVSSLAAGETRTGLTLYLPNYYYDPPNTITIDSTQIVTESNENNNTDSF